MNALQQLEWKYELPKALRDTYEVLDLVTTLSVYLLNVWMWHQLTISQLMKLRV